MKKKHDFILPFSGLKLGVHTQGYELDQSFFEECKDFDIISGTGTALVSLEKKEIMMLLSVQVTCEVDSVCFRCNEPMADLVTGNMNVVIKFGDEPEIDDELWVLPWEAHQLDLFQPIYESVITSLPSRFVHNEQGCNPEALKWLAQEAPSKNKEDIDPRWKKLNNLN
ncbi:MAG: YceD family protein [Flavobacteriales bacterium]